MTRVLTDSTRKADGILAPMANQPADSNGESRTHILLLPLSTTAASFQLPDSWSNKYVDVTPIGSNLKYNIDSVARAVAYGLGGDGTDGNFDDPTLGAYVGNGQKDPIQLPQFDATARNDKPKGWFINYDGDTDGQTLELRLSST